MKKDLIYICLPFENKVLVISNKDMELNEASLIDHYN